VVGHEGKREGARNRDGRRKRSGKKIDHGDGEGSEDQRDHPEISFRFRERIELIGKNKENRRMKKSRVFFVKLDLTFKVIP